MTEEDKKDLLIFQGELKCTLFESFISFKTKRSDFKWIVAMYYLNRYTKNPDFNTIDLIKCYEKRGEG
jgi:hypothetical protein